MIILINFKLSKMFYNTFFLNTLLVISFYYDLILERENENKQKTSSE